MSDTCIVCKDEPARKTLKTCGNCGAWGHRWDARPAADILEYFRKLRKSNRRISQFASVDTDKDAVKFIDHNTLQAKRLAVFKDVTKRAQANIVSIKTAAKRKARDPAPERQRHRA